MLKNDPDEAQKMNEVMSNFDKSIDPTAGAGMNIDDLMNKLMAEQNIENNATAPINRILFSALKRSSRLLKRKFFSLFGAIYPSSLSVF